MPDPMAPYREKVKAGGYSVDFEQVVVIDFKTAMPAVGDGFRQSISSEERHVPRRLDSLLALIYHNPALVLEVRGFTDDRECLGAECVDLSQRRAQMIYDLLMAKDLPSEEVTKVSGFGSAMPIDDNSTEAGRARNRRVEILMALPEP
jgi:flagellar motor protein MotB